MNNVNNALENTLGKRGMSESDINQIAEYLMSFFGFEEHIIDNLLTAEARNVFYMLEEEGFLTTQQEEVHLETGKLWRIHYWVLKSDQIQKMAGLEHDMGYNQGEGDTTYDQVSEECWLRGK
jgi:hypothetical protein